MNDSNLKGKWDEVAGKVKQGVGEAVGDNTLANKGAAQQVKGHVEDTWGTVKDAARDETSTARSTDSGVHTGSAAHDVRESVTSTAQNVKESIKDALGDHRR